MTTTLLDDQLGAIPDLGTGRPVSTAVRTLHQKDNRALRAGLALLDGYVETLAAVRAVNAIVLPPTPPEVLDASLGRRLADLVLAGDPVPENVAAWAREEFVDAQAYGLAVSATRLAREQLVSDLDRIVTDNLDELLGFLHGQLLEVMNRAGALTERGPLTTLTAESAVRTGRVEDLEEFRALAGAYAEIREAQDGLLRAAGVQGHGAQDVHDEARVFRDVLRVLPSWASWKEYGFQVTRDHGYQRPVTPPWPHSATKARTRVIADAKTPEFLAWAVEHRVGLWIPTRAEYEAENQRLAVELYDPVDSGEGDEVHPDLRTAGGRR